MPVGYEIVPCRLSHLRQLVANLTAEDRANLLAGGVVPRHHLFRLWRRTVEPWAMLVGGEVAAIGGDAGDLLAPEGIVWLFATATVDKAPIGCARELRRLVRQALMGRQRLVAQVPWEYERCRRLYRLAGFHTTTAPDERGWCLLTAEAST